ncbi:KGGVGR-motif variant AAA ATPase [Candidatus Magnetaquicoccus inordinatus]|uniref:KGGVGR-motif variant AAA ATPase n=1 Tax=Candidatus Magnetaquicoccus inordinatus TaxID=2496818 RepID=UPI00102AD300|nr:hypothetical protein [Candidatus Magnetaquicoccus inordinatus]
MEIIAFYSFKGGVGRTALLTNLAAYWASLGRVVGLVDMDLAAPGLSYSPLLDPKSLLNPEFSHVGFSDLLAAYYNGRDDKDGLGYFEPDILFHELNPPPEPNPPYQKRFWGNHGRVLVIPAGQVHFRYPPVYELQPLPFPPKGGRPNESMDAMTLRAFAKLFREDMQKFRLPKAADKPEQAARGLDYLLIDCRTGFPELLDLVLGYLADRMILVSGLNEQNLVGLELTLRQLRAERVEEGNYARDLMVVFSPVPVHLYDDPAAIAVLKQGKRVVESHCREKPGYQREEPPKIFTLPYTPRLALSDLPLTFETLEHPYSRVIVEIAESLAPPSLERQIAKVSEQLQRTGVTIAEKSTAPAEELRSGQRSELPERPAFSAGPPAVFAAAPAADLLRLPSWHWPFTISAPNQEQRIRQERDRLLPARSGLTDMVRDAFLDALSGTLSLDKKGKLQLLSAYPDLPRERISEQLELFMAERQDWPALPAGEQEALFEKQYQCRKEWADLLLQPPGEGLRQFLLQPLQNGQALFSSWQEHAPYWFLLARDLRKELNRKNEAWQAIAQGLRVPPDRSAMIELLDLLDSQDQEWNRALLQRASEWVVADQWLQFEVLTREVKPSRERIEEVLEPLLQGKPPKDPWLSLQFAHWIMNNYDLMAIRVEPFLRYSVEKLSSNDNVLFLWGELLFVYLGRFAEAETVYGESIERNTSWSSPWSRLGDLLQATGRCEEAKVAALKAIDLSEKDAYVQSTLGSIYARCFRNYEEAEAAYRQAVGLENNNNWYKLLLGYFLTFYRQRCQEALEILQLHSPEDDSHGTGHVLLYRGLVLLILGQTEAGNACLTKAGDRFYHEGSIYSVFHYTRITLILSPEAISLLPIHHAILNTWRKNAPQFYYLQMTEALLELAESGRWPADRIQKYLLLFEEFTSAIQILYEIGGQRPDLRQTTRAGVAALLADYPQLRQRLKGAAPPEDLIERFRPFAEGRSDGLGDPRDRALFCKESAAEE